jgi:hypothetical protein
MAGEILAGRRRLVSAGAYPPAIAGTGFDPEKEVTHVACH